MIVLTISEQDADVLDAIVAGACGYLLKDSSISDVIAGHPSPPSVNQSLISPTIASKVLQRVRATTEDTEHGRARSAPSFPTASSRC